MLQEMEDGLPESTKGSLIFLDKYLMINSRKLL